MRNKMRMITKVLRRYYTKKTIANLFEFAITLKGNRFFNDYYNSVVSIENELRFVEDKDSTYFNKLLDEKKKAHDDLIDSGCFDPVNNYILMVNKNLCEYQKHGNIAEVAKINFNTLMEIKRYSRKERFFLNQTEYIKKKFLFDRENSTDRAVFQAAYKMNRTLNEVHLKLVNAIISAHDIDGEFNVPTDLSIPFINRHVFFKKFNKFKENNEIYNLTSKANFIADYMTIENQYIYRNQMDYSDQYIDRRSFVFDKELDTLLKKEYIDRLPDNSNGLVTSKYLYDHMISSSLEEIVMNLKRLKPYSYEDISNQIRKNSLDRRIKNNTGKSGSDDEDE